MSETEITKPVPNWAAITAQTSMEDRAKEIDRQLREIIKRFGMISLTELMLNKDRGGGAFIALLDRWQKEQERPQAMKGSWRLKQLINADGTPAVPGSEFVYQVGVKTHYYDGEGKLRPMNTQQQELQRRRSRTRGDDNDPYVWAEYTLDDRCEIGPLGYFEAMAILTNFAQVGDQHAEIVGPEFGEIARYYWLFEEVIPEQPATKGASKTRGN